MIATSQIATALAKLAGIKRALVASLDAGAGGARFSAVHTYEEKEVKDYFERAESQLQILRAELPDWFGELPSLAVPAEIGNTQTFYRRSTIQRLVFGIDEIFEIRANSDLGRAITSPTARRVFISHGRAPDWREVQAFIEKDVGLSTLELAQEPNTGQTIIEKLFSNADSCDSAVIVMTGDDFDATGQARARENVMHEIGYFQGKYGRRNVILLHEAGVSVPTNLSGMVYSEFPKSAISASFYLLSRELNALYPSR